MSFSNPRISIFIVFLSVLLFSCDTTVNNQVTDATDAIPVAIKGTKELAKTNIQQIEFYSDSNKETMNEILTKTIEAKKTPIFFFTADWCKPCKEFKKSMKYELVANSLKDVTLIVINVDKDKEGHAADYGVRAIPTFIIADQEGNAINTITGAAWAENTPENISKAMTEFIKG